VENLSVNISNNIVIATLKVDLSPSTISNFQEEILSKIQDHQAKGMIIDLSDLALLDSYTINKLVETCSMARLLGAEGILKGLRPSIAATIVEFGDFAENTKFVTSLDDGMKFLAK
jgi:anti-anti-sigma factor